MRTYSGVRLRPQPWQQEGNDGRFVCFGIPQTRARSAALDQQGAVCFVASDKLRGTSSCPVSRASASWLASTCDGAFSFKQHRQQGLRGIVVSRTAPQCQIPPLRQIGHDLRQFR